MTSIKKRDIAQELRDDLKSLESSKEGKMQLRSRTFIQVSPPAEIRKRLKLSQYDFAGMIGVSVRTVQDWEQGRREPSGPASALLRIADQEPDVFLKLR